MIYSHNFVLLAFLPIFLGIVLRLLLLQLSRAARPAARFGIMACLLFLYTAVLFLMLHQAYLYTVNVNGTLRDYRQAAILTVSLTNITVLIVGIVYYLTNYVFRGKHRLSDRDKMKLKDL